VSLERVLDKISDHWLAPPNPSHLHIIVEPPGERCVHWVSEISLTVSRLQAQALSAPVLGKRSDLPWLDLPWLEEVHSKIWNRKDLGRELFPNVKVTQADYAALQKRPKELHSDRDSLNYDGNKPDILSVKLEFLRSLPSVEALSPRDADDNGDPEASNEDDLESLFPFTLRFLNLSTLALKNKVTNRLPLPLLRRQEYEHISELIRNKYQNNGGSVIVSGQPGTGEFLVSLCHRI
jgi:hypothetical protein